MAHARRFFFSQKTRVPLHPDAQPDLPGEDWAPSWFGRCPRDPRTPPGPRGSRGAPRPPTSRRPPLGMTPPRRPAGTAWAPTRPPEAGRARRHRPGPPPNRPAAPSTPPSRGLPGLAPKTGSRASPNPRPPGRPPQPKTRPIWGQNTARPPPAGSRAVSGGWRANRRREHGTTPLPRGHAASVCGSAHARKKPPVCYTVTFCLLLGFASSGALRVCLRSPPDEAGRLVTRRAGSNGRNLPEISDDPGPFLSPYMQPGATSQTHWWRCRLSQTGAFGRNRKEILLEKTFPRPAHAP